MQFLRTLLVLAASSTCIHAAIFLPAIFSDGMVLQDHATYDQRPFIYGYADPNELITVVRTTPSGQNDTFLATADGQTGFWIVQCDPDYFAPSQNNLTFTIYGSAAPENVTFIRNVVYGDVFLCGGQSNMNENVAAVFGANETMAGVYNNIRLFSVAEGGSTTPQRDVPTFINQGETPCTFPQFPIANSSQKCNTWQTADEPTIIGSFSAACFYAALSLSQSQNFSTPGRYRVLGMIHSSVSGTPMRSWMPQTALDTCDVPATRRDTGVEELAEAASSPSFGAPPSSDNSTLWNAMIYPISRYAIRGVFWDQGESDSGESFTYFSCLFQSLIASWRTAFRIGDFAWIFAQLGAQDSASWPNYYVFNARLAQASALPGRASSTTDTTGMAVSYDIGDMGSPYPPTHVHSRRKAEVGRRMAISMLHVQYALQFPASPQLINLSGTIDWSAPTLSSATTLSPTTGLANLTFLSVDALGLYLNDTADCWECCAGSKDTFQVATDLTSTKWVNTTFAISTVRGGEGSSLQPHLRRSITEETASVASATYTSIIVTPLVSGNYGAIRYAANLWTQCAIFAVGNNIPVEPFIAPLAPPQTAAVESSEALPSKVKARDGAPLPKSLSDLTPSTYPHWWTTWKGRAIPSIDELRHTLMTDSAAAAAATPPMGFNSWNGLHTSLSHNTMIGVADALIALNLSQFYTYVNMDDGWQVDRHVNGTIIADPVRFPFGIAALAAEVHAKGLNFGLYTAQREFTCQMRPGSWRFEDIDIETYCAWSIDYVKTDGCTGRGNALGNLTWIDFRAGITSCSNSGGRPIVLSVESCSDPNPGGCGSWIGSLANLWRTTGDIQATFASVLSNLDGNNNMHAFAGPGHFNDPDLLQIGNAGLSPAEEQSQMSAWSVVAAPLIISCDLTAGIDATSLAILSNPEVIAVDQDRMGVQGVRVSPPNPNGPECWARPLADGSVAALLLNRGLSSSSVTCTFEELGLKAGISAAVRDLWAHKDLGNYSDSFTAANLDSHASMLITLQQN